MTAFSHPESDLAHEGTYFPMQPGARYDYETRFEGHVSTHWWTVREVQLRDGTQAYSFPIEDGEYADNPDWGGYAFRSENGQLLTAITPESPLQCIAEVAAGQGSTWSTRPETNGNYRVYRHLGFEDVAAPAGRFPGCFKLQMDEINSENAEPHTAYLYFARGFGLVKIGFPDGEMILSAFHPNSATAPPPPRRPTQDTTIGANPDGPLSVQAQGGRKKPWWKFWK